MYFARTAKRSRCFVSLLRARCVSAARAQAAALCAPDGDEERQRRRMALDERHHQV